MKIRSSEIHKIMADPKKGRLISVGAETYCKDWVVSRIYDRRPLPVTSKYLDHGVNSEPEAIEMVAEQMGLFMLGANTTQFENDYITGQPDLILPKQGLIVDTKCSYSPFSFPLFDTELDVRYYWQMQGYMALTGLDRAVVAFCLINAGFEAISKEINRQAWAFHDGMITPELEAEVLRTMTYNDVPTELRYKAFEVERNPVDIERIYLTVQKCKEYIKKLGYETLVV